MRQILKYRFAWSVDSMSLAREQEIEMPGPASMHRVGLDSEGQPAIWALVAPDLPKTKRKFFLVWTGDPVPTAAYIWIGTIVFKELVYHVWIP